MKAYKMILRFFTIVAILFLHLQGFSEPFIHKGLEEELNEWKRFDKYREGKPLFAILEHKLMKILLFAKELNLSQEQQDKIFNVIIQTKQKNDPLSTDILKLKYEILKEMSKTQPDFNKIKSLNSQITKLTSEFELNIKNSLVEILSIFTPEQREKLDKLLPRKRINKNLPSR
ncbi:MAG: Spy/CpxP family protein refolding chaperone [Brevinematia bacterium]